MELGFLIDQEELQELPCCLFIGARGRHHDKRTALVDLVGSAGNGNHAPVARSVRSYLRERPVKPRASQFRGGLRAGETAVPLVAPLVIDASDASCRERV